MADWGAVAAQCWLSRWNSFCQKKRSSFPARNEQLREILQPWANLNCCQGAPSCQPSPVSRLPTFPYASATWSCSPPLGVLLSLGNRMVFGWERAVLLFDLLPRRVFTLCPVKVTTGSCMCSGLGFTGDPSTDHSALLLPVIPTSSSCASPPSCPITARLHRQLPVTTQ